MNIIINKEMSLTMQPGDPPIHDIPVSILHPEIRHAIEELRPETEIVYMRGFGPIYIYVYTGGKHPYTYGRITIEL
jgi:hypothetical protein